MEADIIAFELFVKVYIIAFFRSRGELPPSKYLPRPIILDLFLIQTDIPSALTPIILQKCQCLIHPPNELINVVQLCFLQLLHYLILPVVVWRLAEYSKRSSPWCGVILIFSQANVILNDQNHGFDVIVFVIVVDNVVIETLHVRLDVLECFFDFSSELREDLVSFTFIQIFVNILDRFFYRSKVVL